MSLLGVCIKELIRALQKGSCLLLGLFPPGGSSCGFGGQCPGGCGRSALGRVNATPAILILLDFEPQGPSTGKSLFPPARCFGSLDSVSENWVLECGGPRVPAFSWEETNIFSCFQPPPFPHFLWMLDLALVITYFLIS